MTTKQTNAKSSVRSQAAKSHDIQAFLTVGFLLTTAHCTDDDVIEVRCTQHTKHCRSFFYVMYIICIPCNDIYCINVKNAVHYMLHMMQRNAKTHIHCDTDEQQW